VAPAAPTIYLSSPHFTVSLFDVYIPITSSCRGLRTALIEWEDFGGGTTSVHVTSFLTVIQIARTACLYSAGACAPC
jgi:hypothetical protein